MIISQTGGGCRATNYAGFLRKAAEKAGFKNVPVISFSTTNSLLNKSLGASFATLKDALLVILYGDLLMRLSNRVRPYELYRRFSRNMAYASFRQNRKNNIF